MLLKFFRCFLIFLCIEFFLISDTILSNKDLVFFFHVMLLGFMALQLFFFQFSVRRRFLNFILLLWLIFGIYALLPLLGDQFKIQYSLGATYWGVFFDYFLYLLLFFELVFLYKPFCDEAQNGFVNVLRVVILFNAVLLLGQLFSFYGLGIQFDPTKLFLGVDVRDEAANLDVSGLFYRPSGLFMEPSNFSNAMLFLSFFYYGLIRRIDFWIIISSVVALVSLATIAVFQIVIFLWAIGFFSFERKEKDPALFLKIFSIIFLISLLAGDFFLQATKIETIGTSDGRTALIGFVFSAPRDLFTWIFGAGLFSFPDAFMPLINLENVKYASLNDAGVLIYSFMQLGLIASLFWIWVLFKTRHDRVAFGFVLFVMTSKFGYNENIFPLLMALSFIVFSKSQIPDQDLQLLPRNVH